MKFKYTDNLRVTIKKIGGHVSDQLIAREDINSTNLVDMTDKKEFFKCIIDSHTREMRCGKVIKTIIPDLDSRSVELFINEYRSRIVNATFSIVDSDKIPLFYRKSSYYEKPEKESSLYGSCMTDKPDSYFDIYVRNGVRMVILVDDETGKLLGRSLLWDNVNEQGVSMLDKPYLAFQSLLYKFKNFAEENDFFFYSDIENDHLYIKANETEFKHYPYVDTLSTIFDKTISNISIIDNRSKESKLEDGKVYRQMDCTNGEISEDKGCIYYNGIDDNEPKYTFNYDNIETCHFDGRSYLNEDMVNVYKYIRINRSVHKDYLKYFDNMEYFISKMIDFSDTKMTSLFLIYIRRKMGDHIRYTSSEKFDVYTGHMQNFISGKRKREIIIPFVLKNHCFIKFKIMPSGYDISLHVPDIRKVDFEGFKYDEEFVGKYFIKFLGVSINDFVNKSLKSISY